MLTKESDRFEELYSDLIEIHIGFDIHKDLTKEYANEMLAIYNALKLQIVQFNNKIKTLEEINIMLERDNGNVSNKFVEYQDKNQQLQKENEESKDTIKQLMEFQEWQKRTIEQLQKENETFLKNKESQFCVKCGGYKYICEECEEDIYNTEIDKLKKENEVLKEQLLNAKANNIDLLKQL